MEEYIKRSDVLKNIEDLKKSPWYNDDNGFGSRIIKKDALDVTRDLCVLDVPAVDAKESVYAKWARKENHMFYWYECSNCGNKPLRNAYKEEVYSSYCPHCGAEMYMENEENE